MSVVAVLFGWIAVLVFLALALVVARNPERGLAQLTHRTEQLPLVLVDRYLAFAGLALAATLWGDLRMLLALFLASAWLGFADAFIYARAGHPHIKHTAAGIAGALGALITSLALSAP